MGAGLHERMAAQAGSRVHSSVRQVFTQVVDDEQLLRHESLLHEAEQGAECRGLLPDNRLHCVQYQGHHLE